MVKSTEAFMWQFIPGMTIWKLWSDPSQATTPRRGYQSHFFKSYGRTWFENPMVFIASITALHLFCHAGILVEFNIWVFWRYLKQNLECMYILYTT